MGNLGGFIFATFVVAGVAELIDHYDNGYSWYYSMIVLLGVMIFNVNAVTTFINFGLNQTRYVRGRQSIKRPTKE